MKTIVQVILVFPLVLVGLMLINEAEGEGQLGNPPMLWSREITEPWYVHVGNDDYFGSPSFDRRHFGFPCWAMILDVSSTNGSWYAKIDLRRFVVNGLVALVIAGALVGTLRVVQKKKSEPRDGEVSS